MAPERYGQAVSVPEPRISCTGGNPAQVNTGASSQVGVESRALRPGNSSWVPL